MISDKPPKGPEPSLELENALRRYGHNFALMVEYKDNPELSDAYSDFVDESRAFISALIAKEADRAVQEFVLGFDWRHDGHLANPGSKLYVTKEDVDNQLKRRSK